MYNKALRIYIYICMYVFINVSYSGFFNPIFYIRYCQFIYKAEQKIQNQGFEEEMFKNIQK